MQSLFASKSPSSPLSLDYNPILCNSKSLAHACLNGCWFLCGVVAHILFFLLEGDDNGCVSLHVGVLLPAQANAACYPFAAGWIHDCIVL